MLMSVEGVYVKSRNAQAVSKHNSSCESLKDVPGSSV